jgi:oligopeptide transport system permease protein
MYGWNPEGRNKGMARFVLGRLAQAIPVLWAIATLTFFMVRLAPGDPFSDEKKIPAAIRANLDARYGFDQPLWKQYWRYLGRVAVGDLGPSYKYVGRSVNEIIAVSFPVSLELGLYALIIALIVGLPAGLVAALRRNSAWDHIPMTLAMVGICMPTFVLGPVLALVFGLRLGWFNSMGWSQWGDRVLPSLTLGLYYAAYIARLARGGMLEILSRDFIRTARAKGLSEFAVVVRHGMRGGLLPVVSYLGPAFAGLITGSFVVETIFFVPGLGRYFVTAAFNRDYSLVMGTVLFYAILIVGLNLAVDILQRVLDPRLRDDTC